MCLSILPCPLCSILACKSGQITKSTRGNIFVGRIVTSIALVLDLRNQVAHLIPLRGNTLLDIDHYLTSQLIKFRRPNEFHLLINNEVVHHFVLPNPVRTSVHNPDNWLCQLEGHGEAPTPQQTPHLNTTLHLCYMFLLLLL